MADIDKRLHFYNGQFLQEQDFTAEQEYHLDRQRRHNRQLHVPGIADGLAVTATVGATSASVAPGTALDGEGRQIVLTQPRSVGFASLVDQWVLVVISYHQEESDDATVGDAGKTRWLERPQVEVIPESGAPAADVRIRLARLQIAANGTISQHDTGVRTLAGVRLRPEETLERLRLSRQGVSSNLWPVLSSGAAGRADVGGDLSVSGNILVTGTVDGRDVSADGALNDTHRGRTDNPHNVTAAQLGAITSLAGVSNPGGGISLIGASGITVNSDDANDRIILAGGAPTSIDGVSNPGGNIDFVGQGGISITPDDAANRITFSTSPAAIGALASGDYLRRVVTYGSFASYETTKSIYCGFLPRYIAVTFSIWGSFSSYYHTVYPTGYVSVSGVNNWTSYGSYHYAARFSGAPYWESNSYTGYYSLARVSFYDYVASPYRHAQAIISVDSVDGTGFVLRIDRSSTTASTFSVYVNFQAAILG